MRRAKLIHGSPDEIEAAYYDALARADLEALMMLWSDDEDIVCIHPGAPRLLGHAAIRNSWQAILGHGGLQLQPRQLHACHTMTMAVHNVIEAISHADHAVTEIHVLATNVYQKTPQGWRMSMHHASMANGAAPLEASSDTILH